MEKFKTRPMTSSSPKSSATNSSGRTHPSLSGKVIRIFIFGSLEPAQDIRTIPEEEAYEIALRRIRKAEETGAVELDLSGRKEGEAGWTDTGLKTLNRLPRELASLASLQSLDLSECLQLSGDLSALASLTSLQSLDLSHFRQLSNLSSLAGLTYLQSLNLFTGHDQIPLQARYPPRRSPKNSGTFRLRPGNRRHYL